MHHDTVSELSAGDARGTRPDAYRTAPSAALRAAACWALSTDLYTTRQLHTGNEVR